MIDLEQMAQKVVNILQTECIEYTNGSKHWYLNGKLHREDGPAIEYANGSKEWLVNSVFVKEELAS